MIKKIYFFSLILASVFIFTACKKNNIDESKKVENNDNIIRTAIKSDIQTMDIDKTSNNYMIPLNIFDRLVEVELNDNGTSKIIPSLATSWDISEDGKVYTIKLRENVKFHNGEAFTAEDVIYSLNRMVNLKGAVNSDYVSQIEGFEDVQNGNTDSLSGLSIIDDYTIQIKLKEAYSGFMSSLAAAPASILDKTTTINAGDKFGVEPEYTVGTGPFKVKEWKLNDHISLVKNEAYWQAAPSIDGVEIKVLPDVETQNIMFRNGELDILDLDYMVDYIPKYKEDFKDRLVSTQRVGITFLNFNQAIKPFDNPNIRKAISMAIDRKAIIEAMYQDNASLENGIFPRGLIGYNENLKALEYNPDKAKEILAKENYPNGFEMELASNQASSDTVQAILEIISEQLSLIGIKADVKAYDEATWLATRRSGQLPSSIATWTADYNDPDNFIYTFFGNLENSKLRSINYSDEDIMQRVQKAKAILNQDERIKEYQALEEQIVQKDYAWLPMYSRKHYYALSQKVKNFKPNWAGLSDIQFYSIKKD